MFSETLDNFLIGYILQDQRRKKLLNIHDRQTIDLEEYLEKESFDYSL